MSKKKRNHKRAVAKRRQRIKSTTHEKNWGKFVDKCTKEYSEGLDIMPMPSITEALSVRMIEGLPKKQKAIGELPEYFSQQIVKSTEERLGASINASKRVISFIIPLDFYMPLPEPYHAAITEVNEGGVATITCVTVFSDIVTIGSSTALKTSYIIASICNEQTKDINSLDIPRDNRLPLCKLAVDASNHVISAFRSMPIRHNHYMHQITLLQLPYRLNAFIFDHETKEILDEGVIALNDNNVLSEVLNARLPSLEELDQFRILHVKKHFLDDKVFLLLSKYEDAVCSRCFGKFNEAVLLADSFVELSLGYLYCDIRIASGEDQNSVITDYGKTNGMSIIWETLSEILSFDSITKLRNAIRYDQYEKYCRNVRNNLTHRFMTKPLDGQESLDAIFYAGEMVKKLCALMEQHYRKLELNDLVEKMILIRQAVEIGESMHHSSVSSEK